MSPRELFDLFTGESYYGFNMKLELTLLRRDNPADYATIERFACHCKNARLDATIRKLARQNQEKTDG
jgi:hypothetical protein